MPDIEKVLGELKDKTIIVEGKKDVKALRELGIENIIPINSKPLITIVQGIEKDMTTKSKVHKSSKGRREVVILTDFDEQGRKLYAQLLSLLQSYRIPTNARLRHMMRAFGKTRIEDFNGMENGIGIASKRTYKKEGDTYGETRPYINKVYHKRENSRKRGNRKT